MYSVLLVKINFCFPYIKDELEDAKWLTKDELIKMCNQDIFDKNVYFDELVNGEYDEVITILKQQMKISKYVIFGIPSTYFNMNEKMLGNERSLTLKEWSKLIEQAGGHIIEQTSFHYYKLYRRIFEVKKWFKPKAFWLFVIKKD